MKAKILSSAVAEGKQLPDAVREKLIADIGEVAAGWSGGLPRRLRRRLGYRDFGPRRLHWLRWYSIRLFFIVEKGSLYAVGIFTRESPPVRDAEEWMWRRVERARIRDRCKVEATAK